MQKARSDAGLFFARPFRSAIFTHSLCAAPQGQSLLYAPRQNNAGKAVQTASRSTHMSILDGVSLGLALGLFIYLLVALLRAGRQS